MHLLGAGPAGMITHKRHLSYFAVAATCLIAHNLVMIGTDTLGFVLVSAVLSSFVVVVVLGYLLHSRVTFAEQISWPGFSRYVFAMSLNIPVSLILVWIWKAAWGFPMWIASPAATVCALAINYTTSRWAIVIPRPVSE